MIFLKISWGGPGIISSASIQNLDSSMILISLQSSFPAASVKPTSLIRGTALQFFKIFQSYLGMALKLALQKVAKL
jgi:hypothetical protein